jgi:hypothetical protein
MAQRTVNTIRAMIAVRIPRLEYSMSIKKIGKVFIFVVALTAFCSGANAEKTVFKWVDEDGHVHFSDTLPAGSDSIETETLIIPKSPPIEASTQPVVTEPAPTVLVEAEKTEPPEKETPLLYVKTDVTHLSLTDLNLRCEEAREKMIAPLREDAIAKCKEDKREDPAFCERFNADFGDGGRTVSGSIRPRMFDDLTQCVEAQQEKHRRGR